MRICIDDNQYNESTFRDLNSFMRKSWIQTPDRISKTRFMRPQCVADHNDSRGREMGNSPMALYVSHLPG